MLALSLYDVPCGFPTRPDFSTEEELREFITHLRQVKARIQQEKQERLRQLRMEAERLEKQLPSQDSQDYKKALQRLRKTGDEIGSIEKAL